MSLNLPQGAKATTTIESNANASKAVFTDPQTVFIFEQLDYQGAFTPV